MPKPDQDLLDGHFEGEHTASTDIDHKVGFNDLYSYSSRAGQRG